MVQRTHPPTVTTSHRAWMLAGTLLFLTLLLLPSGTFAKTTVTKFTASKEVLFARGAPLAGPASIASHVLTTIPVGVTQTRAGTQGAGANGADGTTRVLRTCGVGVCTDTYRGAGTARLVAGDFAELVTLTLVQPRTVTGASGFDVHLGVRTAAGWFTIQAYFSTGTTTAATGQTVQVQLYLDLGTTVRPTVLTFDFATDACTSAGACP